MAESLVVKWWLMKSGRIMAGLVPVSITPHEAARTGVAWGGNADGLHATSGTWKLQSHLTFEALLLLFELLELAGHCCSCACVSVCVYVRLVGILQLYQTDVITVTDKR